MCRRHPQPPRSVGLWWPRRTGAVGLHRAVIYPQLIPTSVKMFVCQRFSLRGLPEHSLGINKADG